MEVLNPPIPNSPLILSPFTPKFSIKTCKLKKPYRFHIPISKFHKVSSFPCLLPLCGARNMQISAHFGRLSRRRNSLRKKLLDDQKVRQNSISLDPGSYSQDPNRSFDYTGSFLENLNYISVKESNFNSGFVYDDELVELSSAKGSKSKRLNESALLNDLENWVDQYKKDAEYWGIGSGPIFTVFQDLDGHVERVKINEDEILRRSQVERGEFEDLTEANSKILHAKKLAKEMENGETVIPRNSSIAKFVVSSGESGYVNAIRGVILHPEFIPKLSVVGRMVFCGFVLFWVVKKIFPFGNKEVQYTELEMEMMRRKIKSRKEKELLEKGSVEVVQEASEPPMVSFERPKLDKEELLSSILKAKSLKDKMAFLDSSSTPTAESISADDKIQEIREMAWRAREIEIEGSEQYLVVKDEKEKQAVIEKLPNGMEEIKEHKEDDVSFQNDIPNGDLGRGRSNDRTGMNEVVSVENGAMQASSSSSVEVSKGRQNTSQDEKEKQALIKKLPNGMEEVKEHKEDDVSFQNNIPNGDLGRGRSNDRTGMNGVVSVENGAMQASSSLSVEVSKGRQNVSQDLKDSNSMSFPMVNKEANQSSDTHNDESCMTMNDSVGTKPRVIRSVKEAREFLSRKRDKKELNQEPVVKTVHESGSSSKLQSDKELGRCTSQLVDNDNKAFLPVILGGASESIPAPNACEKSSLMDNQSSPFKKDGLEDSDDVRQKPIIPLDYESMGDSTVTRPPVKTENWMEKNFHEVEPTLKKIGDGFRDNYMVAREKVSQQSNISTEISHLVSNEDESQLDWMKDDKLREIVFQVRENELAGRDPFYLMDTEDKYAFFEGLEKKVEKENEKLSHLHEWLHSNIENLDYGADGISLYDPPEKIIPCWKGPPLEKSPEFLSNYLEQRKALFSEEAATSFPVKKGEQNFLQKSVESRANENVATSSADIDLKKLHDKGPKNSKTVIESSDGSLRSGKKSGKEYWQHTKKWSCGFLESYNAETDPEVKSIMKDIGKDLDRWITEEEIQESADLMAKLPERNNKFIEKKLNKLKREMELFGPEAVVSKYREYADEKEEDYLWWLDLPHVLCIELYTIHNGEQRIGFYALEMAADLELEPKPHHVIAFEDAADCKNLCYIVQAHMDMLGNGNAFVVPRPPKDAFREAKANGFSVTVIRKRELHLSVDQTLEEVEEQICEIGSKIYHDKIMQERSVDMSSLMKGVYGFSGKATKRRSKQKQMLKRPTKKRS